MICLTLSLGQKRLKILAFLLCLQLTIKYLHNLLFEDRTYFDNQENLSKYSREELQHIHYLLHELENYYFQLTLTITDRYEKDDKQTGWKVIRNALFKLENHFDKVYFS